MPIKSTIGNNTTRAKEKGARGRRGNASLGTVNSSRSRHGMPVRVSRGRHSSILPRDIERQSCGDDWLERKRSLIGLLNWSPARSELPPGETGAQTGQMGRGKGMWAAMAAFAPSPPSFTNVPSYTRSCRRESSFLSVSVVSPAVGQVVIPLSNRHAG